MVPLPSDCTTKDLNFPEARTFSQIQHETHSQHRVLALLFSYPLEDATMKNLCSVCTNVFRFGRTDGIYRRHQEFIIDLKRAVDKGCQLCTALWRSLTIEDRVVLGCDPPHLKNYVLGPGAVECCASPDANSIDFLLRDSTDQPIFKSFSIRPVKGNVKQIYQFH